MTFTPTAYAWDFGDGGAGEGAGIQSAAVGQARSVEHLFAVQGEYDVTSTRHFSASFTLPNGGGSHTLDGTSTDGVPDLLDGTGFLSRLSRHG